MKILIADDERMARLGLKLMLEELFPEEFQFIEATNGLELVAIAKDVQPEIIFLDIKMPLLDGLSGFEESKQYCPESLFIILSGYSNFTYAKKALQLGAKDYLLKPVPIEDLQTLVEGLKENITNSQLQLIKDFNHRVMVSYNHYQSFHSLREPNIGLFGGYILSLDHYDVEIQKSQYRELSSKIKDYFSLHFVMEYSLFFLDGGELFCLIPKQQQVSKSPFYFERFIHSFENPLSIFSFTANSLEESFQKVNFIMENCSLRYLCGYHNLIDYDDLKKLSQDKYYKKFTSFIDNMIWGFIEMDELKVKDLFSNFCNLTDYELIFAQCDKVSFTNYLYYTAKIKVNVVSLKDFMTSLKNEIENMYKRISIKIDMDLIEKVKSYINENYMKDVGINTLAYHFDLTPNYLSRIFKQKTGIGFVDYLTEIRICNAKRIICVNPKIPVKELATLVGYTSSRYFSKLFAKQTGILPSEYQKRNLGL